MRIPRSHLTPHHRIGISLLLVITAGLLASCDSDRGEPVSADDSIVVDDSIDRGAETTTSADVVDEDVDEDVDGAATTEPDANPGDSGPDSSAVEPPATAVPTTDSTLPDASTTGVRDASVLKRSGSVTVSTDGAVVENLDVTGTISIEADNVTVRNVRVTSGGGKYLISIALGRSGVVIEDVELNGLRISTHGVVHGGYTARRVNMYGVGDGFRAGSDTVIEDSWVHDLGHDGAFDSSPHYDAVQSVGGNNIVIRNNRLEGPFRGQTSAIIMKADFAAITNVVIENNLLSGGTYSLYLVSEDGYPALGSDVQVRNNVWVRDSWKFGPLSRVGAGEAQLTDNTQDDGTPL